MARTTWTPKSAEQDKLLDDAIAAADAADQADAAMWACIQRARKAGVADEELVRRISRKGVSRSSIHRQLGARPS